MKQNEKNRTLPEAAATAKVTVGVVVAEGEAEEAADLAVVDEEAA